MADHAQRPAAFARLLGVVILCGACEGDDLGDASCEGIARHLESVCGEGVGSLQAESFRYDCDTFGYSPSERNCLAHAKCDESLDACGLHSRTWVCGEGNEDCPPGLACDFDREECVACMSASDCEPGRLCVEGLCIRDTPTNRMLAELLE